MKKAAAALCCGAVMLASCADSASGSGSRTVTRPAPDFTALSETDPSRKDVYVIIKNMNSNYWDVVIDGAKDGGEFYGCNVYLSGTYVETDWEEQVRLLDIAVEAGADAVLLAPDDSVQMSEKITEIYDMGIPVVLIDTIANTDSYQVCYMTDNLKAGQDAAEEMISRLRTMGAQDNEYLEVGIQVISETSLTINERLAGFLQYWTENAPDSWNIITDIQCSDSDKAKACRIAEQLFDEHPDIRGVFGPDNGSAMGFAKAVKARKRKDIAVVGFDYCDDIAALINDDEYTASSIVQRQYYMSYNGIGSALRLLKGEILTRKFVDTGTVVVNPDTIDSPEAAEALPDDQRS